jgi:hypothetical protein
MVAWVTHRGAAWCELCVDDDVYTELERLYNLGPEAPWCVGRCGRVVLDLRNRGQRLRACSAVCRRRPRNVERQFDRRLKLEVLPLIRCAECGADLYGGRSDMRYCSSRCRVRAHRRRRQAATT